jgi:hypothetical protein
VRAKEIAALGFVAAAALVALLLPGAAGARVKPASRRTPPQVSEKLFAQGTNGFLLEASLENRRALVVSATKFDTSLEGASYKLRVHPRRGSDDMVARLGKLGRIDMRFVPLKVKRKAPERGCTGGDTVIEEGAYVGVFAFHGEGGFTRTHVHRAPAEITRVPALTCRSSEPEFDPKQLERELEKIEREEADKEEKGGEGDEADESESISVALKARARNHRVSFFATKSVFKAKGKKGFALTNIVAAAKRDRGRIEESSFALYFLGRGSTFLLPNRRRPAAEAILKPPAPFSGSATFRRQGSKPPSWTGDLRVDLPGFGDVRLAGPGAKATMCEGLTCIIRSGGGARSLARLESDLR